MFESISLDVMFRVSPSLAQIGGDLSVCTQIFLGTTATIPQKQDPYSPANHNITKQLEPMALRRC